MHTCTCYSVMSFMEQIGDVRLDKQQSLLIRIFENSDYCVEILNHNFPLTQQLLKDDGGPQVLFPKALIYDLVKADALELYDVVERSYIIKEWFAEMARNTNKITQQIE